MSSAPVRGIVPHRQRRHHHHHHEKHQRRHNPVNNRDDKNQVSVQQPVRNIVKNNDYTKNEEVQEKRPKVNPIFLWAAQREQRIVEVRCEDYDKRNRIKLTKTAQGWRSIPRTALTAYPIMGSVIEYENEQQKALSITSKNEEKENTTRGQLEIKQVRVDELETTQINNVSKVDETQEEREIHKRKRKKHSEPSKNKKRRIDSETEESNSKTLVTTNWKMKKRRKLDKNKKKKKLCLEEIVGNKDKVDNQNEIKIKEEAKKEVECIEEIKKTEESNVIDDKEHKKCINKSEKAFTLVDHKKCNDLEKVQKNRHLQPRVVLEQLHLSQLPTRLHRRQVNRPELESNAEQSEGNNANEIVHDNVENNSQNNNENQIDSENEETILDKEDWLEMLNILDSNHDPINVNGNKSSLIEIKNLTKKCTKLDTAILTSHETNDNKFNFMSKESTKNEHELTVAEKRIQFERTDNIKHCIGTKSLDETIERLERSINKQKKVTNEPNILTIEKCKLNKQKTNKAKYAINHKVFNVQNTSLCDSISVSGEHTFEEINMEKDIIESSKILNALRNTPGLSVSLATNGKKHSNFINTFSNTRKILPSSRSPDSQTEVAEKIGKSHPDISIVIPAYSHRSKTASPILKHRVESPESTVNCSKNEQYRYEADTCETEEDQDCDSQVVDEIRNQNNCKRLSIKYTYQNHEDTQTYFDNEIKNYSVDSTKVPNFKSVIQLVSRNSEAQAKYSGLSRYQEIDNFDEQMIEEFHLQVSPQPSGIPYSISSRRSSAAYLERLLPSPPCSVSCSEDAKNDLTLKGILSSPNNIDTRNQDKKEQTIDLNNYCDPELNVSYNISDETFTKESLTINKSIINQKSQRYSQEKVKYLEMKNHRRPMSSSDIQYPFARDYTSPKRPLSAEWTVNQQKIQNSSRYFSNNLRYASQEEFISRSKLQEMYPSPTIFLDPASQLRELIKTSGHLIPDPLLVPRDYLPFLAGAPLTEIPKLLTTRPELRLPEALTRPELLTDPDLLVISLAHLQHVLDHGEGGKSYQSNQILLSSINATKNIERVREEKREHEYQRPKLSCKPIGKLMPTPMDLSNNQKLNLHPPLLRVRSGLLKQEPEVSSTANSPDDSQLWHPLFGSQKQRQCQQRQLNQQDQQRPERVSWHRTTLAS